MSCPTSSLAGLRVARASPLDNAGNSSSKHCHELNHLKGNVAAFKKGKALSPPTTWGSKTRSRVGEPPLRADTSARFRRLSLRMKQGRLFFAISVSLGVTAIPAYILFQWNGPKTRD